MTNKEYFERYSELKNYIRRLEYRLKTLEEDIGPGAINYTGMPHGHNINKRTEEDAIKLAEDSKELQMDLIACKRKALTAMHEISLTIEGMPNEIERELFHKRYIELYDSGKMKSLRKISKEMGYSEDRIKHIHSEAMKKLTLKSTEWSATL